MKDDRLAARFRRFAERECRGSSPLYERLAGEIATDQSLLALASAAPREQPLPNLWFAAIQYLLLSGVAHELQEFYPSFVDRPKDARSAFPALKDFCELHEGEIVQLLQTRRVQTNEVSRCAYLYPAFCSIYRQMKKPLALVELGTAAGLNLIWDRYAYAYNGGPAVGAEDAVVLIRSECRAGQPGLESQPPPVDYRVGVDVAILDLTDGDHFLWLRSLIWPEHKRRLELFRQAAEVFKSNPPRLIQGNALEMLETLSLEAPAENSLCVYHTHVANQLSALEKERLLMTVDRVATRRTVCHLYNNLQDGLLHLDMLGRGTPSRAVIGRTDGHARWFEWRLS